jgi:hypothetical protein
MFDGRHEPTEAVQRMAHLFAPVAEKERRNWGLRNLAEEGEGARRRRPKGELRPIAAN